MNNNSGTITDVALKRIFMDMYNNPTTTKYQYIHCNKGVAYHDAYLKFIGRAQNQFCLAFIYYYVGAFVLLVVHAHNFDTSRNYSWKRADIKQLWI